MFRQSGFTLSELLVALSIMGIMASFTIPKVLNASQSNEYKQRVQLAAAMISSAYSRYQVDNNVTTGMKPSDLTPYMNYVKYDTSGTQIDNHYTLTGGGTCNATTPCVVLHNGTRILFYDPESFGSLAPGYAILFQADPDGIRTSGSTTNGPGKMIELYLYATNGRIATRGEIDSPTYSNATNRTPNPALISPWFGWN